MKKGENKNMDRFCDSSFAYQKHSLKSKQIRELQRVSQKNHLSEIPGVEINKTILDHLETWKRYSI